MATATTWQSPRNSPAEIQRSLWLLNPLSGLRWKRASSYSVSLSDFGATAATLTFDMMLGEPKMLRERSAITQLRILAGLAEKVIRDLAPLA
jgi:hypothetical protein